MTQQSNVTIPEAWVAGYYTTGTSPRPSRTIEVCASRGHKNAQRACADDGTRLEYYLYTVKFGKFNKDAQWVFTNGQCHAFAYALANTYGWKVAVIIDEPDAPKNFRVLHCVVETDDGQWVDANGYHNPSDYMKMWENFYEDNVTVIYPHPEMLLTADTATGFARLVGQKPSDINGFMLPAEVDYAYSVLSGWEEKYGSPHPSD